MPSEPVTTPDLTLVFPCFNEEQRLPASLERAREYLESRGGTFEILVVDDGSTDGTVAAVERLAAEDRRIQVLQYDRNHGKGYAVRYGMLRARGRAVLFSDADLSTPIEELEKMLPLLDEGVDVVIGSRAMQESKLEIRQPWWRERAGRLFNLIIRHLSGMPFPDTQCGFKLFSSRAARGIFQYVTVESWMFDVEVLIVAQKLGLRIQDVAVVWRNNGDSRVKARHLPRIFRELVHIRAYWLNREPKRDSLEEAEMVAQPTP